MIEIKNLTVTYGKRNVIDGLTISLDKGKIFGLIGENGSGKSTLMRVITGLEKNYTGEVKIDGKNPGELTNRLISYQPDHLVFDKSLRVKDIGHMYAKFYEDFDHERYIRLIRSFHIGENLKIKECSKGMKDKVQIAASLSRRTNIYLLDEPMTGIDPKARKTMLTTIIENFDYEGLLVISTHLISEVEKILDQAVFIGDGKVQMNKTIDEIREDHHMNVEDYFTEVL